MEKMILVQVRKTQYFTRLIPIRFLPTDSNLWDNYICDELEDDQFGTDPWSSPEYDIEWGGSNDS